MRRPSTTSSPAAMSTSTRPTASSTRASSGRAQRGMRRSPFYAREEALGAVFFDARGWERPQWYTSNDELFAKYPQAARGRAARVGRPLVVADHQRRTPGDARHGRHRRPDGVQRVRRQGPGGRRLPPVHVRQQRRRRRRPLGLHAAAHRSRRVPRRPDDPAPRRPSTSGSSPARSTVGGTTTGSTSTSRPTAR